MIPQHRLDVLSQFTPGQKITNASQPDTSSQISLSSPTYPPPPPPPTASTASTFRRPRNNTRVDALPTSISGSTNLDPAAEAEELDFSRELAKGMENLMRELSVEGSITSTDKDGSPAESVRALKAVWEQMLVEGMDGDPGVGQPSGDSGFQDKIKQAVNKLKESESSLQVNYNFSQFLLLLTNYLKIG